MPNFKKSIYARKELCSKHRKETLKEKKKALEKTIESIRSGKSTEDDFENFHCAYFAPIYKINNFESKRNQLLDELNFLSIELLDDLRNGEHHINTFAKEVLNKDIENWLKKYDRFIKMFGHINNIKESTLLG